MRDIPFRENNYYFINKTIFNININYDLSLNFLTP